MTRPHWFEVDQVSGDQIAGWLDSSLSVVVPTDTVYGLAALPDNPKSVRGVFALKGRPATHALPIIVGRLSQLDALGLDFNPAAQALAEAFWPGPLTLILGFKGRGRPEWLQDREEVAVRWPNTPILEALARAAGPFLLTSANGHGAGPKSIASAAVESLDGVPDIVIDGGKLTKIASTIVNTRATLPKIERLGALTSVQIEAIAGPLAAPET